MSSARYRRLEFRQGLLPDRTAIESALRELVREVSSHELLKHCIPEEEEGPPCGGSDGDSPQPRSREPLLRLATRRTVGCPRRRRHDVAAPR